MNDNGVTVGTFYQLPIADMAREILEAAGIECWLVDDHASCLYPPATFGGVKLLVRKKDEAAAHEALQHLENPLPEGESAGEPEDE